MFIDVDDAPAKIKTSVAVIGAGPAGMSMCLELARLGIDTALLCGGTLAQDQVSNDLSRAISVPPHHVDPVALQARRFGGLSWSWGGRCVTLDPADFVPRPDRGLPGWPISREELLAEASAAAKFLGIGEPEFDLQDVTTFPGACLALERWSSETQLARSHHDQFASASGPTVYLGATCTHATINENGRVSSIKARTINGRAVEIGADYYVLAAGGIETARLLLWFFESHGQRAPAWTGRGYMGHLKGQIAHVRPDPALFEFLDYHRSASCYVRRRLTLPPEDLENGLPNLSFHLDNRPMADPSHGSPGLSLSYLALSTPGIGPRLVNPPMRNVLLDAHGADPRKSAHLANILRSPASALRFGLTAWVGRRSTPARPGLVDLPPGKSIGLSFYGEERPSFSNRVSLGAERDANGVPRISIHRDLHDDDIRGAILANRVLTSRIASLDPVVPEESENERLFHDIVASSGDGYHQIGLARMGRTADESVTDPDALVHGLENLYVAGSAAFPRSGHANPTFTIVCQALRLAKHLAHKRQTSLQ